MPLMQERASPVCEPGVDAWGTLDCKDGTSHCQSIIKEPHTGMLRTWCTWRVLDC